MVYGRPDRPIRKCETGPCYVYFYATVTYSQTDVMDQCPGCGRVGLPVNPKYADTLAGIFNATQRQTVPGDPKGAV